LTNLPGQAILLKKWTW